MLEANLISSKKAGEFGYFIEELSNAQFISYTDLTSLVGVTQGTAFNEGAGWLRFEMDGKELIVAKKSIRHSISWDHINAADCVYGNKTVTINGKLYKVRLLTGADTDPTPVGSGYYMDGTHNSEWSRLFYPIVNDDAYIPDRDPSAPYTQLDLGMRTENGRYTWCQETPVGQTTRRVGRGTAASSSFGTSLSSNSNTTTGWRACLELIP